MNTTAHAHLRLVCRWLHTSLHTRRAQSDYATPYTIATIAGGTSSRNAARFAAPAGIAVEDSRAVTGITLIEAYEV